MTIRKAKAEEFERILWIYETARAFMAANGNPTQWGNTFPKRETLLSDIAEENLFVLEEDGELYACFYFRIGEDPTYRKIFCGEWKDSSPYGVIHRVASDGRKRGIFPQIVVFCEKKCAHLRIDTHPNNLVMQKQILRCGFTRCGIIDCRGDGKEDSLRFAYEKY